jgi:hypothetical protein
MMLGLTDSVIEAIVTEEQNLITKYYGRLATATTQMESDYYAYGVIRHTQKMLDAIRRGKRYVSLPWR